MEDLALPLELDAEALRDRLGVGLRLPLVRTGNEDLIAGIRTRRMIGAEALLRDQAIDERIGEAREMTRSLPHLRVHDDRCVETDDVLALVDHRAPPLVHDVALELDAERSVVISAPEPSIDLARLKHEASLFRDRDHLLHEVDLLGRGVGRARDFLARDRKDVRKRLE